MTSRRARVLLGITATAVLGLSPSIAIADEGTTPAASDPTTSTAADAAPVEPATVPAPVVAPETATGATDTGAVDTGAASSGAADTGTVDTGAVDTGAGAAPAQIIQAEPLVPTPTGTGTGTTDGTSTDTSTGTTTTDGTTTDTSTGTTTDGTTPDAPVVPETPVTETPVTEPTPPVETPTEPALEAEYDRGYQEGYQAGYAQGWAEGEQRSAPDSNQQRNFGTGFEDGFAEGADRKCDEDNFDFENHAPRPGNSGGHSGSSGGGSGSSGGNSGTGGGGNSGTGGGGNGGTGGGTTPLPPVDTGTPSANADEEWQAAFDSGDATVTEQWFQANTGPSVVVSGTVTGGSVRSQADADALTGHIVTGNLSVDCDCTLRDFVLQESEMQVTGGTVAVENVLIDGRGNTEMVGVFTARDDAVVTLSHVEITGHNDGIRAYASSVTGEYVYIHDVAPDNPRDHHQDGIQTIGGTTAFDMSYIDMTNAATSATLIKPDASPIPSASITHSVVMGGGYTFHVHDGPHGTPGRVDLSGNVVTNAYRDGLVSTWQLSNPASVIAATTALVSGTGQRVALVDGARIPQ